MTASPVSASAQPMLRAHAADEDDRVSALVRHLAYALAAHVRRLSQRGLPVPSELGMLTEFLVAVARTRPDPSTDADSVETGRYVRMSNRLLVTKGEAAERLSVSVRTIERLVSTGRLPQVHVERSARFRVTDLEAFVNELRDNASDGANGQSAPRDLGPQG